VVPEQREQQDDRQRNAEQPKQCTSTKSHGGSPLVGLLSLVELGASTRTGPAGSIALGAIAALARQDHIRREVT
jgi:hypothetical protein